MAVLRKSLFLFLGIGLGWSMAFAQECPFSNFSFSGYVQGRATFFLSSTEKPDGPLTDFNTPSPGKEGEPETTARIKHLEVKLMAPFPWPGWSATVSGALSGPRMVFNDSYLEYQVSDMVKLKAGQFRVPFGIEPQTPTEQLDTVERSLIYGFGNFGWAGALGLKTIPERDDGLRLDLNSEPLFASFAPFFNCALLLSQGYEMMGRLGVTSRIQLDAIRNELTLAVSGAWGWKDLPEISGHYIPLGETGSLATNLHPLEVTSLGSRGMVGTMGADINLQMNNLLLQAEWVHQRIHNANRSEGYYLTGTLFLEDFGLPGIRLIGRWEEAQRQRADGIHWPGQTYQAATGGVIWDLSPAWQIQLDAITLWLNRQLHPFPGSDLLIAQLQFKF